MLLYHKCHYIEAHAFYCFEIVSFIGTQSVALCRKKLKIGDINFTTGENDANTCNGDTVTTPNMQ